MAYSGTIFPIPFGQLGLRTDDPMTSLPPNALINARNLAFFGNRLEKSQGSRRFNYAGFNSKVLGLNDFWNNDTSGTTHRVISVNDDEFVYRSTTLTSNLYNFEKMKVSGGASNFQFTNSVASNQVCMVAGGQEASGNKRRLFIITGTNPVVNIAGDSNEVLPITTPALDWATDYPSWGVPYLNRMVLFGNGNRAHTIYLSDPANHQDFAGSNADALDIFPGEFDGLTSGIVYRGVLLLFKRPFGVYVVDGRADPGNTSAWTVSRYSDAFGISSPHGAKEILSDLVLGNNTNSITSLQTTNQFGDLESGDILRNSQVEEFFRDQLDFSGIFTQHSIYYPEKKIAYFTGKSGSGEPNDRFIVMDVARGEPRIGLEDKDLPNCLARWRDAQNIERIIYGTENGHIFLMDVKDYFRIDTNAPGDIGNVGAPSAYFGEFQTPFIDFSFVDQSLGGKNKLWDFIEVQYVATGNYSFFVDVSIDGLFSETITFNQNIGAALDSFVLDVDKLGNPQLQRFRMPLHGSGRTISFRVYNGILDQNFKIERVLVEFRVSDEGQPLGTT